jgi:hypothetical protein
LPISQVVLKEYPNLHAAAHQAIVQGLLSQWGRCAALGNLPQEPDIVAGLALVSAPMLYASFAPIFRRHGITFSIFSVYCHQAPKVTYSGMRGHSCELGDILLVHIHREGRGYSRRNAILFQAKVASDQPHTLSSAEQDQLKLYAQWPAFTYWRSPPLTGALRTVFPQSPHLGAQYMQIDGTPPNNPSSGLMGIAGTFPIGCCLPGMTLNIHNDLATELLAMLINRSGMPFGNKPIPNGQGWTETIWDLIDLSLGKVFRRIRSGRTGAPRVNGGPVRFLDSGFLAYRVSESASNEVSNLIGREISSVAFGNREPPGDLPYEETGNLEEMGISLILLETEDVEGTEPL